MTKNSKTKTIWHTAAPSSLGRILIAATEKGICSVQIGGSEEKLRAQLHKHFYAIELAQKNAKVKKWTRMLINYLEGKSNWPLLPYDVNGTMFQQKVWRWLRTVPAGKTYHYSEVAKAIGKPKAVRAVARACAANSVAVVVPCHRILPKSGGIGGYRWNSKRKKQLLDLETQESKRPGF